MPDTSPKVFISHAGEDKAVVLELGAQLRSSGVDAWVSDWELLPGDSLVEGILQRGIEPSNFFVVVLSRSSVTKPWVRKELAVAIERSVSEGYRIIPVLLDGLVREDVPTGLRDILWIAHSAVPNTASEILRSVMGHSTKPPLGTPPAYFDRPAATAGLVDDPGDDLLLRSLLRDYANYVKPTSGVVYLTDELARRLQSEAGFPVDAFDESMHELTRRGLVVAERMAGHTPGRWFIRDIPGSTWWAYGISEAHDMEGIARRLLVQVMNDPTVQRIDEFEELPFWIVKTACWWLSRQGLMRYHETNTGIILGSIEPTARRWLRSTT